MSDYEAHNEEIADAPKQVKADGEYAIPVVPSLESAVPVSVESLSVDPSARAAAGEARDEGATDSSLSRNEAPAALTAGIDGEEAGDKAAADGVLDLDNLAQGEDAEEQRDAVADEDEE